MKLHPLTEVGIGMLVTIMVGRREVVVDLQRDGERRHRQHSRGDEQGQKGSRMLLYQPGYHVGASL
ncbi:MAG TPA: hypothetical protein VFQ34_08175 [Nitrospiraceae bacterium]|nr:hypothetical protein [Nitrospiraceae bacterium]